ALLSLSSTACDEQRKQCGDCISHVHGGRIGVYHAVRPPEEDLMQARARCAAGVSVIASLPLLFSLPVSGQQCPDAAALATDVPAILAPVRVLADDAFEGRVAGSHAERCAGDYIASRFAALGLEPAGADGYFQDVPLASLLNPHAAGGTGRNVIAVLPGTDATLRDEYVIVGAHYDHLGSGGTSSLAPGVEEIHNGADDNASGVAALLDVATRLAADPPKRSVLFLAFTGEESGLLGSAFWVGQPTSPLDGAIAMLNMDMVGRLGDGPLIVYGTGTAHEWEPLLDELGGKLELTMSYQPEGYGPSDHTSFYTRDVPVLHFFTNTHEDYHKPSDDWEKIDVAGLEKVSTLVTQTARRIADAPQRLALVRGVGQPRQQATEGQARGSGAWLGTVPDYAAAERGVRIGGVTPGSPAETAGMKGGDILIGMAGREIADLQAMFEVLSSQKPGDTIELVVLRDGTEVRLQATLGTRANRGS